ncbi:MAG: hypothetical protein IT178_04680 [Acidobacteria bacterium]|nr:hypothetical protein [Acidobacteriota bacterium]
MVITKGRFAAAVMFAAALVCTQPAAAQQAIGFTGGVSVDPEQVYGGVFWQSPDLGGGFSLRPGIDGGVGNGLRMAIINVDFIYGFPLSGEWSLVTGGGPAVVMRRLSDDRYDFGTDVSAGLNYMVGFAHDKGFFGEFRLAGGAIPLLKVGVGWKVSFD